MISSWFLVIAFDLSKMSDVSYDGERYLDIFFSRLAKMFAVYDLIWFDYIMLVERIKRLKIVEKSFKLKQEM